LLIQLEVGKEIFVLDARRIDKEIIKYILLIIKDSNKLCYGHSIKFDIKMIYTNFNVLLDNLYDTMLGETLINQGIGKQFYSYKDLVSKYSGVFVDKEERNSFIGYMGEITNEQINYAAIDVLYLREIKDKQLNILEKQKQLKIVNIEMENIAPLASMELNGVKPDQDKWKELSEYATIRTKELYKELLDLTFSKVDFSKFNSILEMTDTFRITDSTKTKKERDLLSSVKDQENIISFARNNINLNSHSQLLNILRFIGYNLESTNEKVLIKYKYDPIIDLILLYREFDKKRSTYGDNLISELNPKTNRLHAEYNQLGTVTGRYSVSRIHQIPHDKSYRKGFISDDNYFILTSDYNQQEYRLCGSISGEERIIESYKLGYDMHITTASLIYKIPIKDVTSEQRVVGKTINFAIIYGVSKWGLAKNLGISQDEAEDLLSLYWKGYPILYRFKSDIEDIILTKKYSVTPYGRKRFFEDRTFFEDEKDRKRYLSRIRREGFNHIIQGCGADIIKLAENKVYYENPFDNKLRLYLQSHDEIVIEGMKGKEKEIEEFVVSCMLEVEQPLLGDIPAKVNTIISDSWEKG